MRNNLNHLIAYKITSFISACTVMLKKSYIQTKKYLLFYNARILQLLVWKRIFAA